MKKFDIKDYLPSIRKPSRYIDGEVNSVCTELDSERVTFALCFPDTYEIGMSHLGLQILYQTLNGVDGIGCERGFAPWKDMERLLRDNGECLGTLESGRPLKDFDIVGFSLQYELSFTNILLMLDLGGIPFLWKERCEEDPLVIGGGPLSFNPEPVADFFDAVLLGDGEVAVVEIAEAVAAAKADGASREETLNRLAEIDGVYVPGFFRPEYNPDDTVKEIVPLKDGYESVKKRIVHDLNSLPLPSKPVVPFAETVHDRLSVEIARGCTRGCRFCHAGMVYRPARERSPENVMKLVKDGLENTGYDEVSLLSLSTGDYCSIDPLMRSLMSELEESHVAVSFPSLRVGTLSSELVREIKKVKKTGFTLAPEAGTERLRKVINKTVSETDLIDTAKEVFSLGWRSIKLYFMIGLPTETKEDLEGIVRLSGEVGRAGGAKPGKWRSKGRGGRGGQGKRPVNVGVGTFVPKPHTPFQWEPQIGLEETRERLASLKSAVVELGLTFKWHDPEMSELEGVFARGDRRLAAVILDAYRRGARFCGWSEEFAPEIWRASFEAAGMDTDFYTVRRRSEDELFPWEHLDSGVTKEFLLEDLKGARELREVPDCKVDRCTNCGVCDHKAIKNVSFPADTFSAAPVKAVPVEGAGRALHQPLRVRMNYSKTGLLRLLGHLEVKETLTRAFRRSGLPVRYSEGFHPKPRIAFSNPVPVGIESLDEYLDVDFSAPVQAGTLPERLNSVLPNGLKFSWAMPIGLQVPSLSANMKGAEYLINVMNGPYSLEDLGIEFLDFESFLRDFNDLETIILRVRRGADFKEIDIKPLIGELEMAGERTIKLALKAPKGPGVKPHEVLSRLTGLTVEESILFPILKERTVL